MWVANRFLGLPLSTTNTRRRDRPSISAADSPATPPPAMITSHELFFMPSILCGRSQNLQVLLLNWQGEVMKSDIQQIGARLRRARQNQGLTLEDLAQAAGM